jgi:hypothetical protein
VAQFHIRRPYFYRKNGRIIDATIAKIKGIAKIVPRKSRPPAFVKKTLTAVSKNVIKLSQKSDQAKNSIYNKAQKH